MKAIFKYILKFIYVLYTNIVQSLLFVAVLHPLIYKCLGISSESNKGLTTDGLFDFKSIKLLRVLSVRNKCPSNSERTSSSISKFVDL